MSLAVTRVDFYHDADNKLAVAARIAQKGVAAGLRVLVSAPDEETARQIDRILWTFSPNAFVPHAIGDSPLASESPVVIVQKIPGNATLAFGMLINLADTLPSTINGFGRVIEIVTRDDQDKSFARERYKAYRELDCELVAHRLGQDE